VKLTLSFAKVLSQKYPSRLRWAKNAALGEEKEAALREAVFGESLDE